MRGWSSSNHKYQATLPIYASLIPSRLVLYKKEVMKKTIKIFVGVCVLCLSGFIHSATPTLSQDIGKISTLYVSIDGDMAFILTGGFPNAIATGQCPGNNGHAGLLTTADPAFKSAILAAKAAQQTVRVTISGCLGGWFKVMDIYVE